MNYGEFAEQDGLFIQDRGDVVCIVWPSGAYAFTTKESWQSGNWYLPTYGQCKDAETAKAVADSTGWKP